MRFDFRKCVSFDKCGKNKKKYLKNISKNTKTNIIFVIYNNNKMKTNKSNIELNFIIKSP
jgi:hypothetical protein